MPKTSDSKLKVFFAYRQSTIETGGWLAEHIAKKNLFITDHGFDIPATDILIRWGSVKPSTERCKYTINKKKAIELARDKFQSLITLKNAGIETPRVAKDTSDLKLPVLGRKFKHQEGKDLFLCLQKNDVIQAKNNGAEYFVQYIPTKKEYRIHIINNKVVKVFEKIPTYTDKTLTFVRNNAYSNFKATDFTEANKIALKAIAALGLDFGAVDVILGDDNDFYVLECNTAPRLNHLTLNLYVEELTNLILQLKEGLCLP